MDIIVQINIQIVGQINLHIIVCANYWAKPNHHLLAKSNYRILTLIAHIWQYFWTFDAKNSLKKLSQQFLYTKTSLIFWLVSWGSYLIYIDYCDNFNHIDLTVITLKTLMLWLYWLQVAWYSAISPIFHVLSHVILSFTGFT